MVQRDPLGSVLMDGPASGRARGASLPFLPTLATALAVGALSLLCQHGVSVAPAPAAPAAEVAIGPTSFAPVLAAGPETGLPAGPGAARAFAQLQPLVVEPPTASARAPRIAAVPVRRACPGPRCAETAAAALRRANPFAAMRQAQTEQAETEHAEAAPAEIGRSDGPDFPSVALPFAPAARVVGEAAGMMRASASSLGTSVVVLIDRMR